MDKRKGFTLIELLVVIAIIALLMSILIPALAKAKNLAKAAMCAQQLHTWGIGFALFANDHDDNLSEESGDWVDDVGEGYCKNKKLCLCPMATKTSEEGGRHPFMAVITNEGGDTPISYGYSEHVRRLWRTPTVKGAAMAPVFGDMCDTNTTRAEGEPMATDQPPEYDGDKRGRRWVDEVRMFCTNRHHGAINMLFLDWSVRRVGLKGLWNLRWYPGYPNYPGLPPMNIKPIDKWPTWMSAFSDKIY